jgi:hypothetical protein
MVAAKSKGLKGFQPGNKAAKNADHGRNRPITQAIIAKLHEMSKTPGVNKEYIYQLVDELFEHALSKMVGKGKNKVRVLGDLDALKHIIDRADGKPVQGVGFQNDGDGKVTILFGEDEKNI